MSATTDNILSAVGSAVNALAPFVGALLPEAAAGIAIGSKIIQGVIALEPTAVSLYNRIISGAQVSISELQSYVDTYHADDDKLAADIAAALAKTT